MASGGCSNPPVARFFREKNRHFICIWFLEFVTKILLANFYKKIQGSSRPKELSRDFFSTGGKWKFAILGVFRAHLRQFSIFFHKFFMVVRSYRLLATHIKSMLISILVGLERRFKVSILPFLTIFAVFEAVRFDTGLWPMTMIFY